MSNKMPNKIPNVKLTVIIKNDAEVFCGYGETVTYRSVSIQLTQDQLKQLSLKWTGLTHPDYEHYEIISQSFLEEASDAESK